MNATQPEELTRIALFIDGGYFDEVSRYYKFGHPRASRLSVEGLFEFVQNTVADLDDVDAALCPIPEAHYFRGRFSAAEADAAGKLRDQAAFDDILIRTGVRTHYLPVGTTPSGAPRERGIDVSLSLEAFDLAVHKGYEVLALVACDGDYAHLLRKLSGIGVRSLVLAWDFRYEHTDGRGRTRTRETRTAQALIDACTYPVMMAPRIDDAGDDEDVDRLFVAP